MIFKINGKRYIEFTEERFIYCLMNQFNFFVKRKIDDCPEHPETTFFELTFFKTKSEIKKIYSDLHEELENVHTDTFIGHMIEDNAMELTENHDNMKFVVAHQLLD
jgi:hypothetical protein